MFRPALRQFEYIWLATLNPAGGRPSSRLAVVDGPVSGLSAGCLQGASCQKHGAGEGVLYAHFHLVSLVNFSAKQFCYWLCLLSCLGLLECSVLTWPPAGYVPVTCWRGGYCPSQGVVRTLLVAGTVLKSTAGMFLRIRSDFEVKWELAGS